MRYELIDLETGNVVRAYASEAAALRDVAATVRRLGPEAIADLALGESEHPAGGSVLTGQLGEIQAADLSVWGCWG